MGKASERSGKTDGFKSLGLHGTERKTDGEEWHKLGLHATENTDHSQNEAVDEEGKQVKEWGVFGTPDDDRKTPVKPDKKASERSGKTDGFKSLGLHGTERKTDGE